MTDTEKAYFNCQWCGATRATGARVQCRAFYAVCAPLASVDEIAKQNKEASASAVEPMVIVRGWEIRRGSVVKFFDSDEEWWVEEVRAAPHDLELIRVRHYPTNREHGILARHIHSLVRQA